jgi:uncharacterized coiled-coil protein SlyX
VNAIAGDSSDTEVIAQELGRLTSRVSTLESSFADIERVITRLEEAAATTARGMEEISSHWDAVYRAMRRAE